MERTTTDKPLTPHGWQKRDVARLVEAGGIGLVNAEPGAGKTLCAVETVRELEPEQTVIVAPLSTLESAWGRTFRRQMGVEVRRIGTGNKAQKDALTDLVLGVPGVYVCTPQWFTRADISAWDIDMAIIDEVHLIAKPGGKGQKQMSGYVVSGNRDEWAESLSAKAKYRLALSGTPIRNKFSYAWSITRFLWPEKDGPSDIADPKFYRWAEARMTSKTVYTNRKDKFGNPVKTKQFETEYKPGQLFSQMPTVIQHFARSRCCDAHPEGFLTLDEATVIEETIELLPAQKKAIREMETQMVTYLEDNPMVADIPLTAMQRVRQMTLAVPTVEWEEKRDKRGEPVMDEYGQPEMTQHVSFAPDAKSPLLDRILEVLDELGDEPVLMFCDSQKYVEMVTNRLNKAGVSAAEYSGKRKADINGLGTDYRVLVAVISSVGVGTDGIQDRAATEMWLSRDLDETNNRQGEARLERTGQKTQVRRYIFEDDNGIASGRRFEQLAKRVENEKSTTVAV